MAKVLQIVERNRASSGLRLANYFIDFALCFSGTILLFGILAVVYSFITGSEIDEVTYQMENINGLVDRVLTMIVYAVLMFLTEWGTNGRSVGKYITGTKVVKADDSPLTAMDLLKRSFSRIVPFDALSFLGKNGWHDSWSDTRVVKLKDFEKAKSLDTDINAIGMKESG
ncbi:RDD family protein [Chryseobacterium koreense]|uniref:RDD domain-containing protein n=1 Tax=Chryseobacterium koreense CCUG 49689 TaxID=1304281 RepID=A0A0J7IZK8_9FLAO|nr:RDD family protein [Chryseobacterium koreense]KMQ71633.1 hypothetical protein ACM44_05240 [Chryseobacterium koreense CCUG 49689]MBB5333244.1 putative RDD family membrane protein YckC [Chryseobacterium koreense]